MAQPTRDLPLPVQIRRLAVAARWHQDQVRQAMAELDRHVAAASRIAAELQKLADGGEA